MKLFEQVIEQRLRSYLEDIGFINKYQSGFRQNKSTARGLLMIISLGSPSPLWKASTEVNMWWLRFLTSKKLSIMFDRMDSGIKFLCLISLPK